MQTNDTGYAITVGPDKDGNHFSVEPGAGYELPDPPVSETETETTQAHDPPEAPDWRAIMRSAAEDAKLPAESGSTSGGDEDAPNPTTDTDPSAGDSQEANNS